MVAGIAYGGSDQIIDGAGDDVIIGGHGDDFVNLDRLTLDGINASDGQDVIVGDGASAYFDVSTGASLLSTIATRDPEHGGNDAIFTGNGHDVVFGGSGNDRLAGGDGADLLSGDAGNDVLTGGDGSDMLQGGEGDDTYVIKLGDKMDLIVDSGGRKGKFRALRSNGLRPFVDR